MNFYNIDEKKCNESISGSLQETIQHGNRNFPCASYTDHYYSNQKFYPWHWHKELELAYVASGSVTVFVDENKFELKSGEGIFINSYRLHSFFSHGDETVMPNIVFSPVLLYGTRESIFWDKYVRPFCFESNFTAIHLSEKIKWQAKILEYAKNVFICLNKKEFGFEFRACSILSEIIICMMENDASKTAFCVKKERETERVRRMLSYIQMHYSENISIKQISDSAFISKRECLRCFKEIIKITPIQYVIELRISKAKQLLLETDMPIIDICMSSGFDDQSYFTKVFRKKTGLPPLKFRKLYR